MPIAPPSLFLCSVGMLFVPEPFFLHLFAALAVVGMVAVVVILLRADLRDAAPPIIVTRRRPRALAWPEAA
jgi:hypothetical protein